MSLSIMNWKDRGMSWEWGRQIWKALSQGVARLSLCLKYYGTATRNEQFEEEE